MRIGVWGAGAIGTGLVYRLVTTPFTSELHWINRSLDKISYRVVDIEHGLALAPNCWSVRAHSQDKLGGVLSSLDALVITLGEAVPAGGNREMLYPANRELFRRVLIPALQNFKGIVLVVTNPVDLMSRLLAKETNIPPAKVIGLGTVVETARLRASLASYLSPKRPARELWAYAIGTHDERFVPVLPEQLGLGATIDAEDLKKIVEVAHREVTGGARRVKTDSRSTLHPIVEGAVQVLENIASDRRAILTVSTLDPASGLYYSVPCSVGARGVVSRHLEVTATAEVSGGLERCKDALRKILVSSGELI